MCSSLDFPKEQVHERFSFIKVLILSLQIKYTTYSWSMEDKVFLAGIYRCRNRKRSWYIWHAPHALTWTWPNTRGMLNTRAEVYTAISPREFQMEQTKRCDVVTRKLPAVVLHWKCGSYGQIDTRGMPSALLCCPCGSWKMDRCHMQINCIEAQGGLCEHFLWSTGGRSSENVPQTIYDLHSRVCPSSSM
jgi:hypothetical protein